MFLMGRVTISILFFTLFSLVAGGAYANQITAADYLGGGTLRNFDRATGYSFTLDEDVHVTGLGLWDHGADGFASSHNVGIFNKSDFSLISSANLSSGTSGTFVSGTVGGSRFADVSFNLMAGVEYYILADNFGTDKYAFGTTAVAYDSVVNWGGFVDAASNDISSAVSFNNGLPGNVGPNFQFEVVDVPEPSSLALVALGLLGFGYSRIKKTAKG